mmetsp:Transcript_25138/g.33334  ORF Transcript_25138/g.33334 Transcript_25138/m.33334 type:complete len:786 (+) Transcript_25138:286-2643(+)
MPSMKSVKKFTKSKKKDVDRDLEAQKRARELAEELIADAAELDWYNEELAIYDQRQVGTAAGGKTGDSKIGAQDYFLSLDDSALHDEKEIPTGDVDVDLGASQDLVGGETAEAAAAAAASGKGGKSSGKKMKFLRRSKSSKSKSKVPSTPGGGVDDIQDQLSTSRHSSCAPGTHDDYTEDLLGLGGDGISHQLPPPPSASQASVEEFTARRSARVASNKYVADGDTWVENLAVVELPPLSSSKSSSGRSGRSFSIRRSRASSSQNAESDELQAAANATKEEEEPPRLAIRPYFQSLNTGVRVWDEPPSGASNVQYASAEVRKMAEAQMADMRHNAEAVLEARHIAKLMEEERKASSSSNKSSIKLLPKFGKKKKTSSSDKNRGYKTAEDLGITHSPKRGGNGAGDEFGDYDEDMQMAIAMSIGNDGVISRYDEVSERGGEDEALAMAISLSEQEEKRKQQNQQEDLLVKMAIANSRADMVDDRKQSAASVPLEIESNLKPKKEKSKEKKRSSRFRSRRSSSTSKQSHADHTDGNDGGGKMPAKSKTNTVDSDNPFDQYASDISSSSIEVSDRAYPAGTTIDDLLGSTDVNAPRHKSYSQPDGYLGVGYEHGAEERMNMSVTSASSMSTRSEHRRSNFANNRARAYSHETSGSIPSIQSVDFLDVEVPGSKESDNSYSSSVGGGGGVGGDGTGGDGTGGGLESGTDGEASITSVSSALRKKLGDAMITPRKKITTALGQEKGNEKDEAEGDTTSVRSSLSLSSARGRKKKKGEQSLEESANAAGLV